MSDYPSWICAKCGIEHAPSKSVGKRIAHVAAFHQPDPDDPNDKCGWCGSRTEALTEPRDYGYPAASP